MSYRLDKYAWSVRLAKTRSIANTLISKGKIRLNGEECKSSKDVKVGDIISVQKNNAVFEYKVLDLLDRRVGAKLVEQYLKDITDPLELEKYREYQLAQKSYRPQGGKPNKKDRRELDDFLDW
ncbi:MAG: RNA-binding S4 domain-containing protein [Bacteroidetes bacterium]|nr:MAG: RNA-binding S4 domain-containing protein [Bacteroidota bacterium]